MNLEEQLRDTLTDDRRALPGWADATDRVRRGVTRRRRRRNLALAGVAVAVVALVGVPALLVDRHGTALPPGRPSPSASASGQVVPWLDVPGTPPDPARPSPRPTAVACAAGDLESSAHVLDEGGGAAGTQVQFVALHNIGSRRCTLGGYPPVSVRDGSGALVPLAGTNEYAETPDGGEDPATVDPGEYAQFAVRTSLSCNGGVGDTVVDRLYVTVAGRTLPIDGLRLDYTCPQVGVGRWYRLPGPTGQPGAFADAGVTAVIEAPATVAAGATLDYRVALTNPGDAPVPLDPCPVYQENLYKGHAELVLNCLGAGGMLPPHSTVRFAMRLVVPDYAPAGVWPLTWQVDEARGPAAIASAQVTVTR